MVTQTLPSVCAIVGAAVSPSRRPDLTCPDLGGRGFSLTLRRGDGHKKRRQAGINACRPLNRSRETRGLRRTVCRLDQPRVTTGGGALPFPTGDLPTHATTPMERATAQIAITICFMTLPIMPIAFVLPANHPVVAFWQHAHSFNGVLYWMPLSTLSV
jgi:hypothetical protein